MSPWAWQDLAACRGKDLNLFFGGEHEQYNQPAKRLREEQARAVCASCPVAADCLAYAITGPERYGIWGGLDEEQRAKERRNATRRAFTAARREGTAA